MQKYIFIQKKIHPMKLCYVIFFGSQIWSIICYWNVVKLLIVCMLTSMRLLNMKINSIELIRGSGLFLFDKSKVVHFYSSGFVLTVLLHLIEATFQAVKIGTGLATDHFSTVGGRIYFLFTPVADLGLLQHLR